jgi:glycosyltransferase involved in cell wall biosynthesis
MPAYYAAADVLVLPSESETWGLVVNEAMACGLPAIVSADAGCVPDLIDEGLTGFTFSSGNVAQLAMRMEEVAMTGSESMRERVLAKIKEYTVEAAVRGTVDALSATLDRTRRAMSQAGELVAR